MKRATITEAKNTLSALIDRVRAGETIIITDRGRPVARLEPAVGGDEIEEDGRLAELRRAGLLRGPSRPSGEPYELPPIVELPGVLEQLLKDRREGR